MAPSNPLDEKTSEVQGSGRTIFYLLKIVGDVIDDELQVSDAHKCAGKKVDNGKRVVRVVSGAVNKGSKQIGLGASNGANKPCYKKNCKDTIQDYGTAPAFNFNCYLTNCSPVKTTPAKVWKSIIDLF